jgi:hypothetical protein
MYEGVSYTSRVQATMGTQVATSTHLDAPIQAVDFWLIPLPHAQYDHDVSYFSVRAINHDPLFEELVVVFEGQSNTEVEEC